MLCFPDLVSLPLSQPIVDLSLNPLCATHLCNSWDPNVSTPPCTIQLQMAHRTSTSPNQSCPQISSQPNSLGWLSSVSFTWHPNSPQGRHIHCTSAELVYGTSLHLPSEFFIKQRTIPLLILWYNMLWVWSPLCRNYVNPCSQSSTAKRTCTCR